MTIEEYLNRRNNGQSLEEIQTEKILSEGTVWTLELGYQCYLKKIPLDKAIDVIKTIQFVDPTKGPATSFNPQDK